MDSLPISSPTVKVTYAKTDLYDLVRVLVEENAPTLKCWLPPDGAQASHVMRRAGRGRVRTRGGALHAGRTRTEPSRAISVEHNTGFSFALKLCVYLFAEDAVVPCVCGGAVVCVVSQYLIFPSVGAHTDTGSGSLATRGPTPPKRLRSAAAVGAQQLFTVAAVVLGSHFEEHLLLAPEPERAEEEAREERRGFALNEELRRHFLLLPLSIFCEQKFPSNAVQINRLREQIRTKEKEKHAPQTTYNIDYSAEGRNGILLYVVPPAPCLHVGRLLHLFPAQRGAGDRLEGETGSEEMKGR